MPTLDWIGKDRVVDYYHQVPYRILNRIPDKGVLDSRSCDCGNMVIHGDNLEALKALLPEYEGHVDCIYIDPPYNTGNEGWVYNDNVNDPRIKRWLGEVVGREGEDLSRHDKWLCMMYPRLQLLRKMLKPTGSIFISIGDDECAALKYVCDEIFGPSCFQGDISWQRSYAPRNDKHGLAIEVEHLLVYSLNSDWMPFTLERTAEMDGRYSRPDGDPDAWKSGDASAPSAHSHTGMVYAIQHPMTGQLLYPPMGRCWYFEQPQMLAIMNEWAPYVLRDLGDASKRAEICGQQPDDARSGVKGIVLKESLEVSSSIAQRRYADGNWPILYFTSGGSGGIALKNYLKDKGGKLPTNLWLYDDVGHTDEGAKELKEIFGGRAVFQNPKPSRLIRRILQIACPDDGLVLDAFAGSGTTAQAVLQENSVNHALRKFILIEMGDYCDSITAERPRKVISGYRTSKKHSETLYEKKLTTRNLASFATFYEEAKAISDDAQGYDKVEGPKMDGSSLVVSGITNKGDNVPGVDSGFSYYELGPALFNGDGTLCHDVSRADMMRYVWYTETKDPYEDLTDTHPYLLGSAGDTTYYFCYEPDHAVSLTPALLGALPLRGQATVIYADRCLVPDELLSSIGVIFKQIPRQIVRM